MKKGIILFLFLMMFISLSSAVQPSGGNLSYLRSETAAASVAGSVNAQAGNVTEINIFGFTTTQAWQGYFGNVTGTIQLADASNNVMYNWSITRSSGEVYASTNQTISWSNIQCFNYTANGTLTTTGETAGATSLAGINLSQLEMQYGVNDTDVDGVNETFTLSGAGTHDLFYTANLEFAEGECRNTRIFSQNGQALNNQFEEVLMYEPLTKSVVFASLLEKSTTIGFDGRDHDFQMLVLENGHGTDTSVTPYYFFVELQ